MALLAISISGCAVGGGPIKQTSQVVATPVQGELTVALDKAPAVGDVTPVNVSVANGTDISRAIVPSQIFAINDSGQRVAPLPPGEAARQAGGAEELKDAIKSAAVSGVAGGALGAGLGAAVGAVTGGVGTGSIIGAATGAGWGMFTGAGRGQDRADSQASRATGFTGAASAGRRAQFHSERLCFLSQGRLSAGAGADDQSRDRRHRSGDAAVALKKRQKQTH